MSRTGRLVFVAVVGSLLVLPAVANARPVSTFKANTSWQNGSVNGSFTISQLESGAVTVDLDHFVTTIVGCGGGLGVLSDHWTAVGAAGSGSVTFDRHLASAASSVTFPATHTWDNNCNGGSSGQSQVTFAVSLSATANDRANRGRDPITGTRFIARTGDFNLSMMGMDLQRPGMLTEEIAQG